MALTVLLALSAWSLLQWHGGLHAWQLALAAVLASLLAWKGRDHLPRAQDLSRGERLALGSLVLGLASLAVSLRPQATLETGLVAALALVTFLVLRRQVNALLPSTLAICYLAVGSLAALVFVVLLRFGGEGHGLSALDAARLLAPNQNLLAGGLFVPVLVLAGAALAGGRSRLAAILALALGTAGLLLAGSRGAYLAFLGAAAWALFRARPARRQLALSVAYGLLLLILAWQAPWSRLAQRYQAQEQASPADTNFTRRAEFWKGSWGLSLARPFLGHGLGAFAAAAQALDLPTDLTPQAPIARYRLDLEHAHNDWLELAVEAGWPCTLLLAAAVLSFFAGRLRASPRLEPLPAALEGVLVALLLQSMVDMDLRTPGLACGALLIAASLAPLPQPRRPAAPAALVWLIFVALISLSARAVREVDRSGSGRTEVATGWLQALLPLDAQLAAGRLEAGEAVLPWSAWAGRGSDKWWWSVARQFAHAKDLGNALAAAKTAVALRPYYAPGWFWLAELQQQLGDAAAADASLGKAVQLEPNFCQAWAFIVEKALQRNDLAMAREGWQRIKASQALRAGEGLDAYTRYIQALDPKWLTENDRKYRLSTVF